MEDSEIILGLIWLPLAAVAWAPWYLAIFRVNRLAAPRRQRLILGLGPVLCLGLILPWVKRSPAGAVRQDSLSTIVDFALGATLLGISSRLFSFLGVSGRDDVIERRNGATLIAIIGALLGATFCFAGANIGEGLRIGFSVISVAAALVAWFFLWYLADLLSGQRISDSVSVDRENGGGIRLAGLLIANGLILGAAAAGDWSSTRFLPDFTRFSWPALLLSAAAVFFERTLNFRASVVRSAFVAGVYLIAAAAWVFHRGWVA